MIRAAAIALTLFVAACGADGEPITPTLSDVVLH